MEKTNAMIRKSIAAALMMAPMALAAQEAADTTKAQGYTFTVTKELPATSVKDQYRSGTCWSFAMNSFLESELLRMGKEEVDLSEMFVVWSAYAAKADLYVRMHGTNNFGGGGAIDDVLRTIATRGIAPEEAFPGLAYGTEKHVHGELDAVLKAYIDAVIKNPNRELSTAWKAGFEGILNAYLGQMPESFEYKGETLTPRQFADKYAPLRLDDYAFLTSYTHHPFDQSFVLEVPDNWAWSQYLNLPIDKLMEQIDNAIDKGYTVCWAADVSEKGFSWKNGLAIVPQTAIEELNGSEKLKWEAMTKEERMKQMFSFDNPVPERTIGQEDRQKEFDNYKTTDDHLMHIVGIATDQNGTKYYKVKNSWGTEGHKYEGYLYASESFVRLKTMSIAIHKQGLTKDVQKTLGKQ